MTRSILALCLFCMLVAAPRPGAADTARDNIKYAEATLPNVSKMMFRKGILKTDDPAAVEEYIRIHHCGLYGQYSRDDFSWTRLREAQARDIQVRAGDVPEGLEILSTLILGQYDLASGQFLLESKYQMNNVAYVTLFKQDGGQIYPCPDDSTRDGFTPRVHPLELQVKLDQPVTLTGFPMTQRAADDMITAMNNRRVEPHLKRQVMMSMRVRVTGMDPLAVSTDPMRRVVLGVIDELRVYDSPARGTLLFKKVFENRQATSGKN